MLIRFAYLAVTNAFAALRPNPKPTIETAQIIDLNVRRRDRIADILNEYEHAAYPARVNFSAPTASPQISPSRLLRPPQ